MNDTKQRGKRMTKTHRSSEKQIQQNLKRAKRYFIQKINTNFGGSDYCAHLTYASWDRPDTKEAADRDLENFLRKLKRECKKQKLDPLKYVAVMEYGETADGKMKNIHFHVILSGQLPREFIEESWRARRRKGEKKGRRRGMINVDRLQPDEYGLEALARYLTKKKGILDEKKWHCSKNLKKPTIRKNDYKYSHRKLETLAGQTDCPVVWQQLYPGYLLTEAVSTYSQEGGWHITVKMRRDRFAKNRYTGHAARSE